MPRIFDNIKTHLLPALRDTLTVSNRADFCVGYFNLRGWKQISDLIDQFIGGSECCCRLLVGMQGKPETDLRNALSLKTTEEMIDLQTANHQKKVIAGEFKNQLTIGMPSNEDEEGLRRLASQIRAKKVCVKLFLGHPLHAKVYLFHRNDINNPRTAFLGSSNLTFSGLRKYGELNIDVLDHDATKKIEEWFEERWKDRLSIDISEELATIIEDSWAGEKLIPPYHIYLKIAYHLSQEARTGETEFEIPKIFGKKLFDFQIAAVKIAAQHILRRNGVLIGDVVGLGKTLMASAVAKIFEEDYGYRTLIICPKNLVSMWEDYRYVYGLQARVLSISMAQSELSELPRYQLVLIDESHNLRNPEGHRYQAIREYIQTNDSKVIMLTATPYNKTYNDLSNQLRLFIPDDADLGIRPEELLRNMGETEFLSQHQCPVKSLSAFEKSVYASDWQELMRLYLIRRTRSFIKDNYAYVDCPKCKTVVPATDRECSKCGTIKQNSYRKYLKFMDGTRSYFPIREPKRLEFEIHETNPDDQYARLYSDEVVEAIRNLRLPRYGLGNYMLADPEILPDDTERNFLAGLSRAGRRLMGFSRINLFKRLESCGKAFYLSIGRHILRNFVFIYAIENGLELPIGAQDTEMLDPRFSDEEAEGFLNDDDRNEKVDSSFTDFTEDGFKKYGEKVYEQYVANYQSRFKWIRADLFDDSLIRHLREDNQSLLSILTTMGDWDAKHDAKIKKLHELLTKIHAKEKVLIFSQFADTVHYVEHELKRRGVTKLEGVTGDHSDPTSLAYRFSPESNERKDFYGDKELRVLVATDVLSEGQNLQDCSIVVNFDLPWAIIRLIQRVGRVDRIGQKHEKILCYSFLPAEGVDRIIRLRDRLRSRLRENAEVVGTDEAFFEDDTQQNIVDLYNESSGILDGEQEWEVDLSSYAYQIWNNAINIDPELKKIIPSLQNVCYSTKHHKPTQASPHGVLLYMKTGDGNDALAWVDENGNSVTESQYAILRAAECKPENKPLLRRYDHFKLVEKGVKLIISEQRFVGGQLGSPRGVRFKTYERMKHYIADNKNKLFDTPELRKAIEQLYKYTLTSQAVTTLNRQIKSGANDHTIADLIISLSQQDRLCVIQEDTKENEPQIICSMGLKED